MKCANLPKQKKKKYIPASLTSIEWVFSTAGECASGRRNQGFLEFSNTGMSGMLLLASPAFYATSVTTVVQKVKHVHRFEYIIDHVG